MPLYYQNYSPTKEQSEVHTISSLLLYLTHHDEHTSSQTTHLLTSVEALHPLLQSIMVQKKKKRMQQTQNILCLLSVAFQILVCYNMMSIQVAKLHTS
jgi:hypothetical protein